MARLTCPQEVPPSKLGSGPFEVQPVGVNSQPAFWAERAARTTQTRPASQRGLCPVEAYANLTVAPGQIPSQDVGREHGGFTADGHVD